MTSALQYLVSEVIADSFSPMWVGHVKGFAGSGRPASSEPMTVPLPSPAMHVMPSKAHVADFKGADEEFEQQLAAELNETSSELFRIQQKLARLQEQQNLQRTQQQQLRRAPFMPTTPPGIHLPRSSLPPPLPAAAARTLPLPPPPGLLPPGLHLPAPTRAGAPGADLMPAGMLAAPTATSALVNTEPASLYAAAEAISCGSSETCSTADPCDSSFSPRWSPKTPGSVPPLNLGGNDTTSFLPPGIPSIGSVGHHAGICKPCDFVGRGAPCRAEGSCKFCHLCGPAERKQRKNERRKMMRGFACGHKVAH